MWAAVRARASPCLVSSPWKLGFSGVLDRVLCSIAFEYDANNQIINGNGGGGGSCSRPMFLNLQEVEKVLSDVKADDVEVIPVRGHCDWTDYMVFATGRSPWHVKNIAQALIYQTKQKQKGAKRLLLPSVEGQQGGKWIVIDSGTIIVHALEENARAYYGLEKLWTTKRLQTTPTEDLGEAFVKVRRKNNSKKPAQLNT